MFENVASKYKIDQKANIDKFQSKSVAIARKNNTSQITYSSMFRDIRYYEIDV